MTELQSRVGIDRRAVVRAGVATAWAVPLVQAAAAAPAFAVSGPANLSTTSGTVDRAAVRNIIVDGVVRNTGGSATEALTALISVTVVGDSTQIPFTVAPAPGGWTMGGTNRTWTRNVQLAAAAEGPFDIEIRVETGHGAQDLQFSVTFTSANGTSGVISAVLPSEPPN